jgi:hypothetical protein
MKNGGVPALRFNGCRGEFYSAGLGGERGLVRADPRGI